MKKATSNVLEFSLEFKYENATKQSICMVGKKISKGECIVLCGRSGSGKTTILRCLNGLIPELYEGDLSGYVLLNNQKISDLSLSEIGKNISFVFQDPRTQFFTLNSNTEVAFGLENYGIDSEVIRKRVDEAFNKFDLDYLRNRNVFQLSSGERQIVAILSAWALNAEVIILDEPTANLDLYSINKLTDILAELKKEGKTLIVSDHRLYYLKNLADRYWYIKNGELLKEFEKMSFDRLSKKELDNLGLRKTNLNQIQLTEKKDNTVSNWFIEIDDLSFSYGKNNVLKNINLMIKPGEVLCFLGHNGSGKTTLGKCICGLLDVKRGTIKYLGDEFYGKALSNDSIFIMQETEFQFFTNSVMNEILYCENDSFDKKSIEEILKEAELWELRNAHPFSLSGGQMQKLTLILSYLSKKKVVVLDEPTSGLDKDSLQFCVKIIEKMKYEKIVIIISHDLEFIASIVDRCVKIENGIIVEDTNNFQIDSIYDFMISKNHSNAVIPLSKTSEKVILDPRVNLLYLLTTVIVTGIGNPRHIFINSMTLLILSLANQRYKPFLVNSIILIFVHGLAIVYPITITIFISNYMPRFLLIGMIFWIILGGEGATNLLAGLRKLKVPEKIIMGCSIVFRFFPVLKNDFKLMSQAIKTRLNKKRKNYFKLSSEYFEAIIVSMVFRVIRIAETLSASAETRGITLNTRKSSYIYLKMNMKDYFMILVLIISIFISIYRR